MCQWRSCTLLSLWGWHAEKVRTSTLGPLPMIWLTFCELLQYFPVSLSGELVYFIRGCTSDPLRFVDTLDEIFNNIRSGKCEQREVQSSIESLFEALCGDFPGAVTVRCSAMQFKRLAGIDNENSNSRQGQQHLREEIENRNLAEAFMPGSFRVDPALKFFLDLIRTCPFYRDNGHEPLLGTPEAEQLLAQVRSRYPHDPRFTPRSNPGYTLPPVDNETKDSLSIFMIFTYNNQCLLCGAQMIQTGRALGHVRSHLVHRPYYCGCDSCKRYPKYFFFLIHYIWG
jgi:hypothetical protein